MKNNILKNLPEVKKIFKGKKISLFLDFDGTLTPIVGRPTDSRLSFKMKEIVRSLLNQHPMAIVTGRGLQDIKEKISGEGLVYAANHGLEVSGDDFTMVFDAGREKNKAVDEVNKELVEIVEKFRGSILEKKGMTSSVHYRLLDERHVPVFLKEIEVVLSPQRGAGLLQVTNGKKVIEIRPKTDWNKGSALEWLIQRRPFLSTFPVYIGDDETDKDAFAVLKDGCGLSIYVGQEGSDADFFISTQEEVFDFLLWLNLLSSDALT